MPKRGEIRKVLIIGSGPIVIGQAAEFDYSGTQACKALSEEGIEVVLVNSNPATIMTDVEVADRVYIEPLTVEFLRQIIARERPDGLLPTMGGQTGLNLAVALAREGILEEYGVEVLGTPLEAIRRAEDRELFKQAMEEIGEPVLESAVVHSVSEALAVAQELGYPVVVRPAYTLGGTGGGLARNPKELEEIAHRGLLHSPIQQVLIERSVAGWKEIEYEVMRDGADNVITVCNMENLDPMGVHTGDSIVVAPSQTLSDEEYQLLRSAALRIIRHLGIQGGCNIQFALDPHSLRYYVIEVNPRVSRSSALASKATGYPIARVAAKIAVGMRLDEIRNQVTGATTACFEPALDYVVVKIPRWPFDKFRSADRTLGTQMKATGEVMAIGRCFEEALLKALRSLEIHADGLLYPPAKRWSAVEVRERLSIPTDERLFAIAEALRRGFPVEEISAVSGIDRFFVQAIANIVEMEKAIAASAQQTTLSAQLLHAAKRLGFSDRTIAILAGKEEEEIRKIRRGLGLKPVYKVVDTCAGEFPAATPYFYSTYEEEDEVPPLRHRRVLVLGSGPIRIGQGIEFDYCTVHAVKALQQAGVEAVIINNNPETVSTDFDTSDRLYFEPLTLEDVLHVVEREQPEGVLVQFGGQTALNLAVPLARAGVQVLGTPVESLDISEDRSRFDALLRHLHIPRPPGGTATSLEEAMALGETLGFPLLVRPSYVLGGRGMEIVEDATALREYVQAALDSSLRTGEAPKPVLIDRYLEGKEVEVDAISDGQEVLIPAIMEHIERAGVHSGDSLAVLPAQSLSTEEQDQIVAYTALLARALQVRGFLNVQFVVFEGQVYVLEANLRASRTVPFVSKATGVPMVNLATRVMLGTPLSELGFRGIQLLPPPHLIAVKAPVFSTEKLFFADVALGPEMKSTGEVMGIDTTLQGALYKALLASGVQIPPPPGALVSVADRDKEQLVELLRALQSLGLRLYAPDAICTFLRDCGLEVSPVGSQDGDFLRLIRSGEVGVVLSTPGPVGTREQQGFRLRRAAAEARISCFTSLDTAWALVHVLEAIRRGEIIPANPMVVQPLF
ncbi:MAG: carbamoyl-phosphate synthase large subunit [Armatimonadota bacterium]|nr:carbamoyl-phosphate synthase large subunit [Armatimonadota bacterium]